MARWDIFDRDRAGESEPRPQKEERPTKLADSEHSVGRGGSDDPSGGAPERREKRVQQVPERATEQRTRYRDRGRIYRLRGTEMAAISDIGKFRTVDVQDLARFAYGGDKAGLRRDMESLHQQGLVEEKTLLRAHKEPRHVVTLTEQGHRIARKASGLPKDQKLYHGFVKAREIDHDADLYRVYQQGAEEIRERGGTPVRVRLDFELKAAVQRVRDEAKHFPQEEHIRRLRSFAEEHGLTVRGTTVHLPDIQIEYETREQELERANLELVSENYRGEAIRGKAESGFSLYARGGDATRVRRALQDTHAMERILSI